MSWTTSNISDQSGKRFLITGSNSGIGFATAKLLAEKGAEIIMACRDLGKGGQALTRLLAELPDARISLVQLDLANLASVRECAAEINDKFDRLDVLINNAGLMMPPLERTADGFEMQFGTNVLGHFAFTGLLLPLILKTPQSRVVWLSSVAHWPGQIDFDNLNAEKKYSKFGAYGQSKLADLMLAYEMQRRLQRTGATTLSIGAHPGGTKSELSQHNPVLKFISVLTASLTQSAEDGAMPSIRAAIDPEARGGDYYGPAGFATFSGPAELQKSSKRSHDQAVAERLWQVCEKLTGVAYLD